MLPECCLFTEQAQHDTMYLSTQPALVGIQSGDKFETSFCLLCFKTSTFEVVVWVITARLVIRKLTMPATEHCLKCLL